jgi:hypothetical protein
MRITPRLRTAAGLAIAGSLAGTALVAGQAHAALPGDPCTRTNIPCRDVTLTNQSTTLRGVQLVGLWGGGPNTPDRVLTGCVPIEPGTTTSARFAPLATYVALQVYPTADCAGDGSRVGSWPAVTDPGTGTLSITFNQSELHGG